MSGRQHRRAVLVAAGDVADEAVGVAHVAGEHGGHEVVRVVRLQVGRAHHEDSVGRGMRLVEGVLRELLGVGPDLLGDLERIAVGHGALVPIGLQLAHDVELLFAHGLAQLVGLASGETGHGHGDLHDLLLVDHGAVGLFQNGAQAVVVVVHGGRVLRPP